MIVGKHRENLFGKNGIQQRANGGKRPSPAKQVPHATMLRRHIATAVILAGNGFASKGDAVHEVGEKDSHLQNERVHSQRHIAAACASRREKQCLEHHERAAYEYVRIYLEKSCRSLEPERLAPVHRRHMRAIFAPQQPQRVGKPYPLGKYRTHNDAGETQSERKHGYHR